MLQPLRRATYDGGLGEVFVRENVVERALSVYADTCSRRRQNRTSRSQLLPLHGGATGADGRTFLGWVALRQTISSGREEGQQMSDGVGSLGNELHEMLEEAHPRYESMSTLQRSLT